MLPGEPPINHLPGVAQKGKFLLKNSWAWLREGRFESCPPTPSLCTGFMQRCWRRRGLRHPVRWPNVNPKGAWGQMRCRTWGHFLCAGLNPARQHIISTFTLLRSRAWKSERPGFIEIIRVSGSRYFALPTNTESMATTSAEGCP